QRPLRIQFQLQLAGQDQLLEHFVLADVGSNVLLDLSGLQEFAKPSLIDARVVGDSREIADTLAHQAVNQIFGNAAKAKPAYHHPGAVVDVLDGFVDAGNDFVHRNTILNSRNLMLQTLPIEMAISVDERFPSTLPRFI